MTDPLIPVLIAGGAGTRLWPTSCDAKPKPFHAFGLAHSLLQESVLRFRTSQFTDPVVVCSARHVQLVLDQLGEIGVQPLKVIAEPEGRNTGPAVVAAAAAGAALWPGQLMLLCHADNLIGDPAALQAEVVAGLPAAAAGNTVIFGVTPTGPSTDYGYIEAGEADEAGSFKVSRFVEKPPLEAARRMAADPRYSWNAGLFLINPPRFLDDARRLAPELARAVEACVADAVSAGPVLRLPASFGQAPAIAVDYAILEKTDRARVRRADFGWGDMGSWKALWEGAQRDAAGNLALGDVIMADSRNLLVQAEDATVVVIGVDDLAVVVRDGLVLVTRRELADQAHRTMDFGRRPDLK
jgi:mannose-1-phosphate guanylyltransferase/mannose-6-phosphate isomerase